MPHVNSGGGDDLASTDEVKVYKDEGEDEKRSSEHLDEDKLGLVTETEEVCIRGGIPTFRPYPHTVSVRIATKRFITPPSREKQIEILY